MSALVCGLAALVAASPASAALDSPSRVSRSFEVQTIFGTCHLGGSFEVTPAPAGIGRGTSAKWADCELLSVTPYSTWLTSTFGGGTPDAVSGPSRSEKLCRAQKWCSLVHSRGHMPPGDHTAHHRIGLDLTHGSGSQTYFLGYPPDCRISNNDSGDLICDFSQTVTFMPGAPAIPAPPTVPAP